MAEEDLEDKESKTEQPTQRKLEKAVEKGNTLNSREVMNFAMLLSLTLIVAFFIPFFSRKISYILRGIIEHSHEIEVDIPGSLSSIMIYEFNQILLYTSPIYIFLIFIIIFTNFLQKGEFIFATEQFTPNLDRISIMKGLQRLFSMKSFAEFLKGIFKITLVGLIIYMVVYDDVQILSLYHEMSVGAMLRELYKIIIDILICVVVMMFIIASADFFYQKYEYIKSLMMSKYEIKQEYKQTEGSPEIKRKQRQIMMDRAQKAMMSMVPKADVIITNPTHYSIALQYDPETMSAPIVLAKGLDNIALKIREIGKKNKITIVENPPLARALYNVDLNQEIPLEHYETVAQIISLIFKQKGKI